jgi:hypothetical protein
VRIVAARRTRAREEVEGDGVEVVAGCAGDDRSDVGAFDSHARIENGAVSERGEGTATPGEYGGVELGDEYVSARRQRVESGAQGEGHAEAAQQKARGAAPGAALGGERTKSQLRAVGRAGHDHAVVEGDQEVALAAAAQLERTVGSGFLCEGLPGKRQP